MLGWLSRLLKVLFFKWFDIFVQKERFEKKVRIEGPDVFFLADQLKTDDAFENGFVKDGVDDEQFRSDPVMPGIKKEVLGGD